MFRMGCLVMECLEILSEVTGRQVVSWVQVAAAYRYRAAGQLDQLLTRPSAPYHHLTNTWIILSSN